MNTHKKSCIYCEEFIPVQAHTCSHCSNQQIGLSQAKEDYLDIIWLKTAPIAYLIWGLYLFTRAILIIMYSLNELYWFLILEFLLLFCVLIIVVEFYVLIRYMISLYSKYGKRGYFFFLFQDSIYLLKTLFTGKIRQAKLDTQKYAITPLIPVIERDTRKLKFYAKANLVATSVGLFFIFGVSIISYQNKLTLDGFDSYLMEDEKFNTHFSNRILDAGIFSIYGAVSTYGNSVNEQKCISRAFVSIGKKVFEFSLRRHELPPLLEEIETQCHNYLSNIPSDHLNLPPKGNRYDAQEWYREKREGSLIEPKSTASKKSIVEEKLNNISF